MANGNFLPSMPFKYIPEILPALQPWEIFLILKDIWKYFKDNGLANGKSQANIRPYIERLRIIMAQNLPGKEFVKIFGRLGK